ncbi:MAG: geranylgeranyl reductase family protein [Halobacteriota archaeon]
MHDVAVVGAGPAGSGLARALSREGHEAVVLERGEVGRPLACSGHVSDEVWRHLPDGARDDLLQNEIRGARFHVDGHSYEFYRDETVSYVVDRVELDRTLARDAERAGAEIRTETEVRDVVEHDDHVALDTTAGDVRARYVAGCDGPRSTVRDALGLPGPRERLHGVLGFADERDTGDFVDVYLDAPDFFGWRIPRGDDVEYGVACRERPREAFDSLFDVEIESLCAGAIPIGPPERTVTERGFLVGDAAAQTKPFTGGGIVYGLTAAETAASAFEAEDPAWLAEYERDWRRELEREISLGMKIRHAWRAPARVQRLALRLFEGEIQVHMDRPSTLFNRATARRVLANAVGRQGSR